MRFFLNELRIIPRITWPIAAALAGIAFWWIDSVSKTFPPNPNPTILSTIGQAAFFGGPILFFFVYTLLVGYVNADARRRGMRHVMWTLLVIFITSGIGMVLYFVLREPMLVECPGCGTQARSSFVFCPQCGTELSISCPGCKRTVESTWRRCAYCGAPLETPQAVLKPVDV